MFEPLILVLFLSVLVEVLIEAVKPLLDPVVGVLALPESFSPYLYLSAFVGVGASLAYGADLVAALGLVAPSNAVGVVAKILTGLIVGRGANFVHDSIARLSGPTGSGESE